MLASSLRVLQQLRVHNEDDDLTAPDEGSGPFGCNLSRNGRWITALDVLLHNRKPQPRPFPCWTTEGDEDSPSTFRLRPYQTDAVRACRTEDGTAYRSGIVEMGCGLGKTAIGGELIRKLHRPAVVVTIHKTSVQQWASHLRTIGIHDVCVGGGDWRWGQPLPRVLVVTYQSLVAACKAMHQRTEHTPLVAYYNVARFGVLILDEVQRAVAQHFQVACSLNASVLYGLSGSLIREDDKIGRLCAMVGPVLYRYFTDQRTRYVLVKARMADALPQGRVERALNPYKVSKLRELLHEHRTKKVIVFSDSVRAVRLLGEHFAHPDEDPNLLVLHGKVPDEERKKALAHFSSAQGRLLFTSCVSDAAIDFPDGCVLVQMHQESGSRQQEVQRVGRTTRNHEARSSEVIHIVNAGSGEEEFATRRIRHVEELMHVTVQEEEWAQHAEEDAQPLRRHLDDVHPSPRPLPPAKKRRIVRMLKTQKMMPTGGK